MFKGEKSNQNQDVYQKKLQLFQKKLKGLEKIKIDGNRRINKFDMKDDEKAGRLTKIQNRYINIKIRELENLLNEAEAPTEECSEKPTCDK